LLVSVFRRTLLFVLPCALLAATPLGPQLSLEDADAYVALLRENAVPFEDDGALDALILEAAQRNFVLLGESSHGTHEFYTLRNGMCERLIADHGFNAVIVEGDWDAAMQVNAYVKQLPGAPETAHEAVGHFTRWPGWLWNNEETAALAEWMRAFNEGKPREKQAGFYGMDLYGVRGSMDAVLAFLEEVDPPAAREAEAAYACLRPYAADLNPYAYALAQGKPPCTGQITAVLDLLRQREAQYRAHDATGYFHALQDAHVVKSAERLPHALLESYNVQWNARATHFADTVERLAEFHGPGAKVIVKGHNTHIGDARATRMGPAGRKNVGQLLRERQGMEAVYAVGISTHRGKVMAAPAWGEPVQLMTTPPAVLGTLEDLMHRTGLGDFRMLIRQELHDGLLSKVVGHRMIGAVNFPHWEEPNVYVATRMVQRYDAFIFLEETSALRTLGN